MIAVKRVLAGCVIVPLLLVASCFGKMYIDARMYDLPGQVLRSATKPTRVLSSTMQVAESLDAYVQPRFEILRDKNFGALRIVYRKHAGVAQLKVNTPFEKETIANVNATHDDYAISLLHCAPKPGRGNMHVSPRLSLLYYNQQRLINDDIYTRNEDATDKATRAGVDKDAFERVAVRALPKLLAGHESRAKHEEWDILMRPVPATHECLSCHTEAKLAAPLGVMVYAVRKPQHQRLAHLP